MKKGTQRVQKRGEGAPTADRFTEEFSGQFRLNPAKSDLKKIKTTKRTHLSFFKMPTNTGVSRDRKVCWGKNEPIHARSCKGETSQISPFRAPSSAFIHQLSTLIYQPFAGARPFQAIQGGIPQPILPKKSGAQTSAADCSLKTD